MPEGDKRDVDCRRGAALYAISLPFTSRQDTLSVTPVCQSVQALYQVIRFAGVV